jgi:hypothetical protein
MWRLRCHCGWEWDIRMADFPGRRLLRSCGREECTVNHPAPKPPKTPKAARAQLVEPSFSHTILFPLHVLEAIREYAQKKDIRFAKAVVELAYEGYLQKMSDPD